MQFPSLACFTINHSNILAVLIAANCISLRGFSLINGWT